MLVTNCLFKLYRPVELFCLIREKNAKVEISNVTFST